MSICHNEEFLGAKQESIFVKTLSELEKKISILQERFEELNKKLSPCLNQNNIKSSEQNEKDIDKTYSPLVTSLKGYTYQLDILQMKIINTINELEL
jgi:TolA-binding protein